MALEEFMYEEIKEGITPSEISQLTEEENAKDKKKGKDKKPKSLFERWFNIKKLSKPKMVAVIYLRNNGKAEIMEIKSKRGFFNIEGKAYHENRDCVYAVGKERIPLAMIPEWSLIPIGTKKWVDKSMLEKFAECQDHLLRGIRHAELVRMGDKDKSDMDMKKIILWGILGIIIVAVLMNYV